MTDRTEVARDWGDGFKTLACGGGCFRYDGEAPAHPISEAEAWKYSGDEYHAPGCDRYEPFTKREVQR